MERKPLTPEQKAKKTEYHRRWYEKNRERWNKYQVEYRKAHKEAYKAKYDSYCLNTAIMRVVKAGYTVLDAKGVPVDV